MITMERDHENYALFTDANPKGTYRIRIDPALKVRDKVAVIAEAFVVKGGRGNSIDAAAEVLAAIEAAGE